MKTLADLAAPAVVKRTVLESDLQAQCVAWARTRGYWARKFSSQSQRSVPDYLFAIRHLGIKFATEFKRPGTKRSLITRYDVFVMSTEAQYEEQLAMAAQGWTVFECDNFEHFKAAVTGIELAKAF